MSTLAQFRTLVSSVIGLDNSTGSAEQQLIDKWVNDGVVEVLRRTRLKIQIANIGLTAGAKDYLLPTGILYAVKLIDATEEPLDQVSPEDIYDLRRGGSSSAATYVFAVNGASMLMVYPTPSVNDTLTFYYVARPVPLANVGDDPSTVTLGGIPSEYHRAIEKYALWQAADYGDDASSQQGDRYQRDFVAETAQIRRDMHRKLSGTLPPAKIGWRRRPPPRDPSVSSV